MGGAGGLKAALITRFTFPYLRHSLHRDGELVMWRVFQGGGVLTVRRTGAFGDRCSDAVGPDGESGLVGHLVNHTGRSLSSSSRVNRPIRRCSPPSFPLDFSCLLDKRAALAVLFLFVIPRLLRGSADPKQLFGEEGSTEPSALNVSSYQS